MDVKLFLLFVSCIVPCSIAEGGLEPSVLCDAKYCENNKDKIVCQTITKKCKQPGKGIFSLSPVTCNCCEYCTEYLEEGELCSVGSVSGTTAQAICGPSLICDPATNKCVKYVEISEENVKKLSKCSKEQRDFDRRKKLGLTGALELRPYCDEHGDYEPYQCVPGQVCYCVDLDGNRIYGEVDFTSSPSYVLRCGCSRVHRAAEVRFGRKIQPGEHFRCTSNGDFEKIQCINDKCFCVDMYDGSDLFPDQPHANITDLTPKTLKCLDSKDIKEGDKSYNYYKTCEQEYMFLQKQIDYYEQMGYEAVLNYKFPNCGPDGGYDIIQIDEEKKIKYCTHPNGTMMGDYKVNITDPLAANMDCKCARANLISFTKEAQSCLQNGNYNPLQCRRGQCYCVDNDGRQIKKEVPEEEKDKLNSCRK